MQSIVYPVYFVEVNIYSYNLDEKFSPEFETLFRTSSALPELMIILLFAFISGLFARVFIYSAIPSFANSSEKTITEQCDKLIFLFR